MGKVVSFEAEVKKRQNNDQNASPKKRRRVGSFAWVAWVLLMICALLLGYGFARSPVFNVRSITVEGNIHMSDEEALALSGLELGEHIYASNIYRAKTMLGTNLWVEQVKVERHLPSNITITIKERTATAAITTDEGLLVVDATGVLLSKQKLLDGLSVIVISGISELKTADDLAAEPDEEQQDNEPDETSDGTRTDRHRELAPGMVLAGDQLDAAMAVIRQMDEHSAGVVSELDVSNTQGIVAHTTYGVDFYLGDKSEFAKKYKLAVDILNSEASKGLLERLDYINVSLPAQPVLTYLD